VLQLTINLNSKYSFSWHIHSIISLYMIVIIKSKFE